MVLGAGHGSREKTFGGWSKHGVRGRLGAHHLPLEDLVTATLLAGLVLIRLMEDGRWDIPDMLGIEAYKPTRPIPPP
ncbi:hypothetical protein [Actinomadura sp. HBU206391]|uniref:hypothetical protein n=1 Tax=Actinomadura sp. HBU206391 TaxID=2731692 RepID=UPI001C9CE113|nr:hypothetical protein [Actinomadura sp. HBU206391]